LPTDKLTGGVLHALIALCLALALINAAVLWGLPNDTLAPAAVLGLHVGSSALMGGAALSFASRSLAVQLTLCSLAAGALGALVWLTALVAARSASQPNTDFSDWLDAQIRDERLDRLVKLRADIRDERTRLDGAHGIEALGDIFASDCTSAKLNALAALARSYDQRMAPALAQALGSHDAVVRVLGAGVLARLQQRHAEAITALSARAERQPRSAEAWRALAQAHMTFAESGLLDGERWHEAMTRARDAESYAQALQPGAKKPLALVATTQSVPEHLIRASA
jgi:hypothetical protein